MKTTKTNFRIKANNIVLHVFVISLFLLFSCSGHSKKTKTNPNSIELKGELKIITMIGKVIEKNDTNYILTMTPTTEYVNIEQSNSGRVTWNLGVPYQVKGEIYTPEPKPEYTISGKNIYIRVKYIEDITPVMLKELN